MPLPPVFHPRCMDDGTPVRLRHPSTPTPASCWLDAASAASVVPDGEVPRLAGTPAFAPWQDVPRDAAGWEALAAQGPAFDEPPPPAVSALRPAAGVAIEEADGRLWLMSPSNAHGGYVSTLPKGRIEHGLSARATAIKEAYEETGLRVELTGYLLDAVRTTTHTRYYRARRTGGHPGAMGWEAQAVHLVPRTRLADFLVHPNDRVLLQALTAR